MVKKSKFIKKFDYNKKPYLVDGKEKQISRIVAFNYIYKKNLDKYPLSFKKDYVVHHIDGDTFNNSIKNLYICTSEQHNAIHVRQKERLSKFADASAIDYFLRSRIPPNQKILPRFEKEEEYEHVKTSEVDYRPKITRKELIEKGEKARKIESEKRKKADNRRIEEEKKRKGEEKARNKQLEEKQRKKEDIKQRERRYIELLGIKRKKKATVICCVVLAVIILLVVICSIILNKPETSLVSTPEANSSTYVESVLPTPEPKLPDYTVEGSATDVLIKNNLDKELSVKVTYRIYSIWFGIDSQASQIFDVEANTTKSFKVYDNPGCSNNPCQVNIISYKKI